MTLDASNPAFVVEQGALYDADRKTLYRYDGSRPDASFAVPEGVEAIDLHAFTGCRRSRPFRCPRASGRWTMPFKVPCAATRRSCALRMRRLIPSRAYCISATRWCCGTIPAARRMHSCPARGLRADSARTAQRTEATIAHPADAGRATAEPWQNWVSLKKALEQSDLPALTAFEVDAANARYHSAQGALYETESGTLLQVPRQLVAETFAIAQGTQAIAANAFKGCTGIGTLQLPEGMQAFAAGYLAQTNVTGSICPAR